MPLEDRLQFAFSAGEVSKSYSNRSDLNKYELGLLLCENFTVSPRGGISTRVGSEFRAPQIDNSAKARFYTFRGTFQDLLLVFGDEHMSVIQDGTYVRETAVTGCTISTTDPLVITHPSAHGYSDGDWIYIDFSGEEPFLAQRYFIVRNPTSTTYEVEEPVYGLVDGTGLNAAAVVRVAKVYQRSLPYTLDDLAGLDIEQFGNTIRLTHPEFARRVLTFNDVDDWDLDLVSITSVLSQPDNVTLTASAAGTTGIVVSITAVDAQGRESLPSEPVLIETSVDYSATAGYLDIECDRVSGATQYNFYRSRLFSNGAVHKGVELGYLGTSKAPTFRDPNITPDFTKTPPRRFSPFASASIVSIEVTNGGTGYAKDDTISAAGGLGDFSAYPIISDSGEILSVVVTNGGRQFPASPTITVNTSTGSGATFTATITPETGTWPALFRPFQQRGVYFGSNNLPTSLWASRVGEFDNYDRGDIALESDPYNFTIDSPVLKPIKHVVALRNGLLIFTENGVTQLRAESGKAITGSNAVAEPQLYVTVSDTKPLPYNLDVLFTTEGSTVLYAMLYTEYTESFKLQELSILASHLIGPGKEISKMVATSLPANLIYMPRGDGRELTLTYLREQEVFAFAQQVTQGNYLDVEVISEGGEFIKYQMVRRFLRGEWINCIERVPMRRDDFVEDYWGVDCGTASNVSEGGSEIYADNYTGAATIYADAAEFSADNVGDVIFLGGGKFSIETYVSSTEVSGTWLRDATARIPQSTAVRTQSFAAGDWEIATPTSVIDRLWHLEGETVSVCADGDAYLDQVVENGTITLEREYAKVYVGLSYECRFKSMPIVSNQSNTNGKPSRIFAVFPRLQSSRGMEFGPDFDHLQEMKDRTDEDWGEQLALRSDVSELLLDDSFTLEQFIVGRQRWPLPATILGYTAEYDWGDSNAGG